MKVAYTMVVLLGTADSSWFNLDSNLNSIDINIPSSAREFQVMFTLTGTIYGIAGYPSAETSFIITHVLPEQDFIPEFIVQEEEEEEVE